MSLDENATVRVLSKGQTLLIERDEDASPTSLFMLAADEAGNMNVHGHGGYSYCQVHRFLLYQNQGITNNLQYLTQYIS